MDEEQNATDVEFSLLQTLRSSDLSDIAKDAAEIGLDAVLKDGLLKDSNSKDSQISRWSIGCAEG